MGNRTNKVGIKIAAGEAGVLNENLIEEHDADENDHKRAYEMTEEELANDGFNPTHDREIAAVLRKIDNARNVREAYYAFLGYTENKEYTAQEIANSQKILNFTQQPVPLMKNDQGNLVEVDPLVAEEQKKINDDAYLDRDSPEAEAERNEINDSLSKSIGNLNRVGNHELGHVLESTLNTEEERRCQTDQH